MHTEAAFSINYYFKLYTGALVRYNAFFGQGTGRILLDYIRCRGTESRLINCRNRGIGVSRYCYHSDDAGVICQFGSTINNIVAEKSK